VFNSTLVCSTLLYSTLFYSILLCSQLYSILLLVLFYFTLSFSLLYFHSPTSTPSSVLSSTLLYSQLVFVRFFFHPFKTVLAHGMLNFITFHMIARKQSPKRFVSTNRYIFPSRTNHVVPQTSEYRQLFSTILYFGCDTFIKHIRNTFWSIYRPLTRIITNNLSMLFFLLFYIYYITNWTINFSTEASYIELLINFINRCLLICWKILDFA
jgi:hypothetical protein